MDDKYNMAWTLDGRSHPAMTLPNDFALAKFYVDTN